MTGIQPYAVDIIRGRIAGSIVLCMTNVISKQQVNRCLVSFVRQYTCVPAVMCMLLAQRDPEFIDADDCHEPHTGLMVNQMQVLLS